MNINNIIIKNRRIFNKFLDMANNRKDDLVKINYFQTAAHWAVKNHTGYFSSKVIEENLINITSKYKCDIDEVILNESFVHVITEVYSIGGHTRAVENLINASSINEKHNIVIINQDKDMPVPNSLAESIEARNGELFIVNQNFNTIDKALAIRKFCSKFEYVVLHTHMCDVVPTIAFGVHEFKRPIIFFNHADHMFWLGVSISDIIAELSNDGARLTQQKRTSTISSILPIPIKFNKNIEITKEVACEELGVEQQYEYIISMASASKYTKICQYDFVEFATKLIDSNKNIYLVLIGPDKQKEKKWSDLYVQTNGRINAVGIQTRENVLFYKSIASCYIDSFPTGSFTSYLEFAAIGIPSFILSKPTNTLDVVKNNGCIADNINQLVEKVNLVLRNKNICKSLQLDVMTMHDIDKDGWKTYWLKLIRKTPKLHSVHMNFVMAESIDDYDLFLAERVSKERNITIGLVKNHKLIDMFSILILLTKVGFIPLITKKVIIKILEKIGIKFK